MPEKAKVATARWQSWPIPVHLRQGGGGGWCVVQGEPDGRMSIGRQVGGVPTLERDEAEAIAAALNAMPAKEPVDG